MSCFKRTVLALSTALPLLALVGAVPVEVEQRAPLDLNLGDIVDGLKNINPDNIIDSLNNINPDNVANNNAPPAAPVSASVFSNLEYFAQYSSAAYCTDNNNSTGTKITCQLGNCARVQEANTTTLTEFENTLETDATGFVAVDVTNSLIVVAFRGSKSVKNWLANINFPVVDTDICADCKATKGFYESWGEAEKQVIDAVTKAREQYPEFKVISTGHSLGGALATLAAGTLRSQGINTDLYTYGAPKVGFPGFASYLTDTTNGTTYRVTHKNDPVPKLPPALLGFAHISPEYYLTNGNDDAPTPESIQVFEGAMNTNGNEGDFGMDKKAHQRGYWGHISNCGAGEELDA